MAQQHLALREGAVVQAVVELESTERVEQERQTKVMPVEQGHQVQEQMYRQQVEGEAQAGQELRLLMVPVETVGQAFLRQ